MGFKNDITLESNKDINIDKIDVTSNNQPSQNNLGDSFVQLNSEQDIKKESDNELISNNKTEEVIKDIKPAVQEAIKKGVGENFDGNDVLIIKNHKRCRSYNENPMISKDKPELPTVEELSDDIIAMEDLKTLANNNYKKKRKNKKNNKKRKNKKSS